MRAPLVLQFVNLTVGLAVAGFPCTAGLRASPEGEDAASGAGGKKALLFKSEVIRSGLVDIDVDISGVRDLWLVVGDGGDGFGCDWADWLEPRLEGPGGTKKLTELKWKSARSDWGRVLVDRNAGGGPLRVGGKDASYGIGTHAHSTIHFEIPAGYTRFRARGGVDNGGTDQGCGNSVQFIVAVGETPPAEAIRRRSRTSRRGGGPLEPRESLDLLDVHEGLELTLFAHEPMLANPTNIDIDARGRVWVTEGVNYRRWQNNRPEGDRIVILEDSDLDGEADRSKVFYQDPSINSALGICVLGEKIFVSVSPRVYVFTDSDGDDRPDERRTLFTGIGGIQHDHGVHAFVFGPDGRLYFNFGNAGGRLLDADGKTIVDLSGNPVRGDGRPYRQGMVFRCNFDGGELETLGHNFRNNYEVCVDSYGTLWQSDNDDDGNRGVRINYVMEYGNFGYQDEKTGAGWRSPRTGWSADIPTRHWHQNDPGVIPNFAQTGAGSPTGICVYEGRLLPPAFHDELIHCDAGPNVVRSYRARRKGAGYESEIVDLVKGRDHWFRPSDVCVAADGSIFIADWYDAGVGGHNMADRDPNTVRGRIYRLAPAGHARRIPEYDLDSPAGAARALKSPSHSVRYLAWTALRSMGEKARSALDTLWRNGRSRHRARALHLLARLDPTYVDGALRDADPDIRITALRIARSLGLDVHSCVEKLVRDLSPQVRRECAIALRHDKSPQAAGLWAELALRHSAGDRWYLEALGLAADGQEEAFFDAWLKAVGERWDTPAGREIVWRSRSPRAATYLARILQDPATPPEQRPRYLRAFDFLEGEERELALIALMASPDDFVASEALARVKDFDPQKNERHREILASLLKASRGTPQFVDLVRRFDIQGQGEQLLALVLEHPADSTGAAAARLLLKENEAARMQSVLDGAGERAIRLAMALGNSGDARAVRFLAPLVDGEETESELAAQAARGLSRSKQGASRILDLAAARKLHPAVTAVAAVALSNVVWEDLKSRASRLLPLPPSKDSVPLPPIAELITLEGEASRGEKVFEAHCQTCHRAGGKGKDFGPSLAEIGDKLGKDALFQSVLDPNAGISFNYEGELLIVKPANEVVGIVVSETEDSITIKSQDAIVNTYEKGEVLSRTRLKTSIMPSGLQRDMTRKELVDLVEFLSAQRKAPEKD